MKHDKERDDVDDLVVTEHFFRGGVLQLRKRLLTKIRRRGAFIMLGLKKNSNGARKTRKEWKRIG
jgi:hypothetical protein